jgi:hypothetical protein
MATRFAQTLWCMVEGRETLARQNVPAPLVPVEKIPADIPGAEFAGMSQALELRGALTCFRRVFEAACCLSALDHNLSGIGQR